MGRAASLALAVMLFASVASLGACAAKPRPYVLGERMPASCSGDVNLEECTGWLVDRILAMSSRTYMDERITSYVASVGDRLVRAHGDRKPWKFVVSDDTEVQAYAGMSRTVFINRGALILLRDEAELAAVLGHEMAHVLGGHLHENYRDILQGDVGRSAESERHAERYARDDEIQADEVSVLLLAKAGYDPRAVERMLRALAATSPDDGKDDRDKHPSWIERIARVQVLAGAHPGGETGEQRFRARMSELVVGDDPRVAAVVGRAAVFAHIGVAVDLPPSKSTSVDGPDVMVELDDASGVGLRAIDSRIATALAQKLEEEPDESISIVIRPKLSLMIVAVGEHAQIIAKRLKDSVRTPRTDELRAIRPARMDVDAPRALWSP